MFGSLEMLQQVIGLAQAQNMTNGDYVFFYVDILEESLKAEGHREAAKPWQSKEGQDGGGLREAFQTVLMITSNALQTSEYQRFHSQVLLRAQKDHGVELGDSLRKNMLAAYYHDVVLLYFRALNETLREGGTKRDTSRILEKMRNLKTIQGVTGTVSINIENIREMDFAIWTMADVESGEYQVVGRYMASEKQIKWQGTIHWKKGGPPLDNLSSVSGMNNVTYEQHPGQVQVFNRSVAGFLWYERGILCAFSSALFHPHSTAYGGGPKLLGWCP
ncbi:atrial natriuretic peptide receptor 2-like [Sphaerodactylus townsendi]|uniref:atrial natriuretic peptide receptor 2-like n=1 Tax=Sphaerodactylus townsendi TaxID=933632 RepID=UPI00202672CA|nr:atrial natriuretic peptide receptor 2-like [Sphaerodactylus townsendi]